MTIVVYTCVFLWNVKLVADNGKVTPVTFCAELLCTHVYYAYLSTAHIYNMYNRELPVLPVPEEVGHA